MNFYELNEKLKKEKLNESFLGNMKQAAGNIGNMIGQNFLQGTEALKTSTDQGWQQVQQAQNAQQNKINLKSEKDVSAHLSHVAKNLGVDPKELQQEIQAFVNKLNQLKAASAAAKPETAPPEATSAPKTSGSGWESL